LREWRWLTGYIEKYFAIDFTNFSHKQRQKAQTWYDRWDPNRGLRYATFGMLVIIILGYALLFFQLSLSIAGFMNVPLTNRTCYLIAALILAPAALYSFASMIARIIIWWGIVGFYLHKEFRKLVISEDWQYTKKRLNELLKEKPYFWRYYYIWRSELRRYFSNLEEFYYHGKKKIIKPDNRK
jgi:fatty acid desaturase